MTPARAPGGTDFAANGRLVRLDFLLLAFLLRTALFFRFEAQGQVPPGIDFDEAFEALEAYRIATTPAIIQSISWATMASPPPRYI